MKKLFTFSVLPLLLLLAAPFVSAQRPDSYYSGRAHSVVGDCVGPEHANGQANLQSPVSVMVSTTGICFVSGQTHRVDFYRVIYGPPCNPSLEDPCHPPLPVVELIATVYFGCDDEIVGYECYNQ